MIESIRVEPDRARPDGNASTANELTCVLLVDDVGMFSDVLRYRLDEEADLRVAAAVSSVARALEHLAGSDVNVVVAGVQYAIELLSSSEPVVHAAVVVLGQSGDSAAAAQALRLGAAGWAHRNGSSAALLDTIRMVRRGVACFPRETLLAAVSDLALWANRQSQRERVLSALTVREQQVLTLFEKGRSREEIAMTLELSPNTVRTHVQRILKRLEVHSVLAALALLRGPVDALDQ